MAGNIDRAIAFAAITVHADQERKSDGTPYVFHPLAVARLVAESGGEEEEIVAAILHDAVEDNQQITIEMIEGSFGAGVASLVGLLTEDKAGTWFERKRHTIEKIGLWPDGAQLIKLADIADNLGKTLEQVREWGHDKTWAKFKQGRSWQYWYNYGMLIPLVSPGRIQRLKGRCFSLIGELWPDLDGHWSELNDRAPLS